VPVPPLPRHSPGVLAAALGDRTVLYDLSVEVVHVLNPSAGWVWLACDGTTDLAAAVAPIVEATGADPSRVERDVTAGIDALVEAGLVGRTTPAPEPPSIERAAVSGTSTGAVHAVLDDGVRFVGDDGALLEAVDRVIALDDARPSTIDLGVRESTEGTVRLDGWGPSLTFGSRQAFLDALPSALNQIAASSSTCLALHAGAVRSPGGEVVVLPATSGSGKTTLTASLVREGWAYATDEAVGVRAGSLTAVAYPKPLVLDLESRAVLGLPPTGPINVPPRTLRADAVVLRGDAGRVGRVVLPRFEPGAAVTVDRLDPSAACIGILEHALNLARVGVAGLEAVCELAMEVPVHRLVHGGIADARAAIHALADTA
jgi:hypothetical protein